MTKQQHHSLKIRIEDLYTIDPMTHTQALFFTYWDKYIIQVLSGYAGTGKTFISIYKALEDVLGGRQYNKLIILRSAVSTRDIGALPGDLEEKGSVFELPYYEICDSLFNKPNAYERLKEQGKIRFSLTSYVRGITFDNSIIVVDEIQNLSYHELYSVMTRAGENSKIIFCGDFRQTDTKDSGIHKFLSVLHRMNGRAAFYTFEKDDIVRSGIVKDFIIASEANT